MRSAIVNEVGVKPSKEFEYAVQKNPEGLTLNKLEASLQQNKNGGEERYGNFSMTKAYKKDAGQKNHGRGRGLGVKGQGLERDMLSPGRTDFTSPRKEALNTVIREFTGS